METPKENKEECCCEGTITHDGAVHAKNNCYVYVKHQESTPQTPDSEELKGNKFTWSPEKAEELQKICDSLNKTPDSMDWEKELDDMINGPYGNAINHWTPTDWKTHIRKIVALAHSSGRREERQFILNILDGIDIADEEMGNKGGGTKAIRHALESRIID